MKKYLYEVDVAAEDAPAKVLRAVGHGKRVLELGCASGVQSRVLHERQGCTVTGIELDPVAAAEARWYCERVIVADLETLDLAAEFAEGKFDVVVIADVLEHLKQPERVLKQLRALVDSGGYIVASIPNVVYAGLVPEVACGKFDYRPYGLLDDTHLRFFTLKSIARLFEQCGLVIRRVDRVQRSIATSEFGSRPLTGQLAKMLELIEASNEEWQTYQFIVEAVVDPLPADAVRHAELGFKEARTANRELLQRVGSLQSRLAWIESRPWYRALSAVRRTVRSTVR